MRPEVTTYYIGGGGGGGGGEAEHTAQHGGGGGAVSAGARVTCFTSQSAGCASTKVQILTKA